jgi:hypothetical protein
LCGCLPSDIFASMRNDEAKTPEPPESPDDELTLAIMPDVMKCLSKCNFFEELDDSLCPADKSVPREHCLGNFDISESILRKHSFDNEELADIYDVLRARGGFCDCEVLYNVAESDRLKAEYWRARAAGHDPGPVRHSTG